VHPELYVRVIPLSRLLTESMEPLLGSVWAAEWLLPRIASTVPSSHDFHGSGRLTDGPLEGWLRGTNPIPICRRIASLFEQGGDISLWAGIGPL
jgi:hypothetical protein